MVPMSVSMATLRANSTFGCSEDRIRETWQEKERRYMEPRVGEHPCEVVGRFGVVWESVETKGIDVEGVTFRVGTDIRYIVAAARYADTPANRALKRDMGWVVGRVTTY
jgi:hypothetical protein